MPEKSSGKTNDTRTLSGTSTLAYLTLTALFIPAAYATWGWWKYYEDQGVENPFVYGVLFGPSASCENICHYRRGEILATFDGHTHEEDALETVRRLEYSVQENDWNSRTFVIKVPLFGESRAIRKFTNEEAIEKVGYRFTHSQFRK